LTAIIVACVHFVFKEPPRCHRQKFDGIVSLRAATIFPAALALPMT
jgi:hypothetical protein